MNKNCCKDMAYMWSLSINKKEGTYKINELLYKKFQTCQLLKNLGENKTNCITYERTLLNTNQKNRF